MSSLSLFLAASAAAFVSGVVADAGITPLTSKTYDYNNLPYQVSPEPIGRGPQFGFNQCNSTTESQTSDCQTAVMNSASDFCLWAPADPNSLVADTEAAMVAWCTQPGRGTRVIPAGAITGVQFIKTPAYIQLTGYVDQTKINLQATDEGGELDPHGADEAGNPLGGLVFTNAWSNGANSTFKQAVEWTNFMGGNQFCFKACDPSGSQAAAYCAHIYDRLGCGYNAPAAYVNNTYLSCDSDNMAIPGVYTDSAGATQTYHQPAESLGAITTVPYTASIPASSNCVTYSSEQLFGTASAASTSAAATGTASVSGSAGVSGSKSGTAAASNTATGSAASGTSTSNAAAGRKVAFEGGVIGITALIMGGFVGFGGVLTVIAGL